jgi:heme exporter protein B
VVLTSALVTDLTSSPAVPVLIVRDLVKQFGRFAALRGVNAEFASGRLYAILGDNGAGKTTLLRSMAGLSQPTRGSICMLGEYDLRAVCSQVGYMAHPSLLYDEMSGMENLSYFAQLYGIRDEKRCAAAISAVGLDPNLTRPIGQYSQGMRQRMSLARALLNQPRVLLLDEPFSNVDLRSAREMVRWLTKLRDEGQTIFVVTHQASLLEGMADEFVWLEDGKIKARTADLNLDALEREGHGLGPAGSKLEGLALGPIGRASAAKGESKINPSGTAESVPSPETSSAKIFRSKTDDQKVLLRAITATSLNKDMRLEWRSKDAINSMLFFSLLVVVIFSFSFNPTAEESRQIAGGLIWVAFLFSSVVALNQTWAREIRNQVLDAYRVSPAPCNGLFLSKALGNFIFVCVLEALMTPLFVIFYSLRALGPWYQLPIVGALGTWALVVNGTFFAAMSLRTRAREIMLPLLLFPISIPAILATVEATSAILSGEYSAKFWIVLLTAYDVVFTIACLFLFDTVLQAE